jgi:hypothetical protein
MEAFLHLLMGETLGIYVFFHIFLFSFFCHFLSYSPPKIYQGNRCVFNFENRFVRMDADWVGLGWVGGVQKKGDKNGYGCVFPLFGGWV